MGRTIGPAQYVKANQPKIQLGSKKGDFRYVKYWVDVEGDEASFTKSNMLGVDPEVDPKKPVRWEQWLGLVQRGRPESLILERLNPPPSEVRAPGPGAVRKVEWLPLAKKHLQGNHVIFHTDAARSYTAKRLGLLVRALENSQQTGDAQTTWKCPGGNLVWSQSRMSHLIVGSPSRSRLVTSQPRASKARPTLPVPEKSSSSFI